MALRVRSNPTIQPAPAPHPAHRVGFATRGRVLCAFGIAVVAIATTLALAAPGDLIGGTCSHVECPDGICHVYYSYVSVTDPSDQTCHVNSYLYDPSTCLQHACEDSFGWGSLPVQPVYVQ